MFCPKCGKENQNTNKFCKSCGKLLPDFAQVLAVSQQFHFAAQPLNLIGQTLDGKYRIEAKLGAGGMGDVYRATRLLIGDTVAIKVLHAHLAADAQAAERFRREAVTATRLRHRNVVALYDVGVSSAHNVPYILMELAEGFSLRQIINQYRVLPLDFVVTATAQVCAALEEAHRLGIVHRDVKPENVIANQTTTGWHVKVLDFGIAKLYNQADIGLTQDGSAMGTPQYMSPEQCMGEPLDARSDIYSVGIMLYEMLAGTVPFKSLAASAIAVHQVQTPPAPPRSFNPNIPPQIEEVVLRALDKRREMRQQSAQQLSQEMIQAATAAFKSGFAAISTAPIAAPDIEPEFDAAGEAESSQTPPDTLLSEIPVENESDEQTVPDISIEPEIDFDQKTESLPEVFEVVLSEEKPDKTAVLEIAETDLPIKEIAAPPLEEKQSEKKTEVLLVSDFGEIIQKAESESILENPEIPLDETKNNGDERLEKVDLTLVFEDAEYILDELFPDEKKSDSTEDDFQAGQPIKKPDNPLPEIENPPPEVLAKHTAEPVLPRPDNSQKNETNLSKETESADETSFFQEIHSKPDHKNFLVLCCIGLLALVFFIGVVGFGLWYFAAGQQTEETAAAGNSPAGKQINPPAGMAYIPGGEFMLGSDTGDEYSRPAHKVSVKPFFMDLTEVTNEDYKKFVNATGHRPPPDWKNNNFPDGKARFPVTGVNWDDANAYAKWAEKRLPTEAEWEFAAKGTDNRIYPWGDKWEKEFANADNQKKGMQEVGAAKGKSPFGLSDMSGNAWEWTSSDAKAYPNGKSFPKSSFNLKIIRGGCWKSNNADATTLFRLDWGAIGEKNYSDTSFRCVKDISSN